MKDRFNNFDNEVRDLVLDFERTVMKGERQFFDVDELEVIIDYYLEVNDSKPLEEAIRYAEYLYPDSTEVRIRRAHQMIAQQQVQPAVDLLEQLRQQEPDNTDVAYSLGVAYGALGQPEKAIALYEEALADGWMPGRVYSNIAEEYYKLEDYPQAIAYYEMALHFEPSDEVSIYNYYDTCYLAHRLEQAVSTLTDITKKDPYNKHAWHVLGLAQRDLGLLQQASESLQFAIAIDKSFFDAYVALSQAQDMMGDTPQAVTTMLRVLEHTEHRDRVYRTVGNLYARDNNFDTAMVYYRKAIDENPADAEAFAASAMCYLHTGDLPSALASIRKALGLEDALAEQRKDEGNAEVYFAAALVHDAAGHFDKASECYERMLLAPNCNETQCQAYTQFLFDHRLYDILIDFGEESLGLYPHDLFYSTYLAASYFYTNRYNKARKMLPDVSAELLAEICPEIAVHPLLGPLLPWTENPPERGEVL